MESAMIVFSVLLALAGSRWADARKQQQLTTQAIASFSQELSANRRRVRDVYTYHVALTAAAKEIDSLGGVHTYAEWKRRVPIWSGFRPPDVATTAWQSALTTGALAGLPYRQVGVLSDAYTLQSKLDAFNSSYIPIFDFSDAAMTATVRRISAYMQTVVSFESALLLEYDNGLAAVGGETTSAGKGTP